MKKLLSIVLGIFLVFGMVAFASATASNPRAPHTLNQVSSQKNPDWALRTLEAEAGNITTVTINATTQTQSWQGYVGNITGVITLDDGNNNTLYDWQAAEPQGEIYATESNSVTWTGIKCLNYDAAGPEINLTTMETNYGINDSDYDGVNETFTSTSHPTFWVGTTTITGCHSTKLYENDVQSTDRWWEILLSDGSADPIFTSIIENRDDNAHAGYTGFDGKNYDFEMLVGENGHHGDDTTTTYYFYVELE